MTTPLATVRPDVFNPRTVGSSAKFITGVERHEFFPDNIDTYNSSTAKEMRFALGSPNAFIDMRQSFFRFNVQITAQTQGGAATNVYSQKMFEKGGIHSLIERLEVRARGPNTRIEYSDKYNQYNALKMNLFQNPYKEMHSSSTYGEGPKKTCLKYSGTLQEVLGFAVGGARQFAQAANSNVIFIADTGGTQVASTTIYKPELGDIFEIAPFDAADTYCFQLLRRSDDQAVNLTANFSAYVVAWFSKPAANFLTNQAVQSGDFAVNTPIKIYKGVVPPNAYLIKFVTKPAADFTTVKSESFEVTFQPNTAFFKQVWPLFLFQGGIEVIFRFANIASVLCNYGYSEPDTALNSVVYDFEITDPRFHGHMIKPTNAIANEWMSQFKAGGFQYYLPTYQHFSQPRTATSNDIVQVFAAARSCRSIYTVIMDRLHHPYASSTALQHLTSFPTLDTYLRTYIKEYQYFVGNQRFPIRPIDVVTSTTHAYEQLLQTAKSSGMAFTMQDFISGSWISPYTVSSNGFSFVDATKFIMCARFDRDSTVTGTLTGVDGGQLPIDLRFDRTQSSDTDGHSSQYYVETCVMHDSILLFSQSGVVLLQ